MGPTLNFCLLHKSQMNEGEFRDEGLEFGIQFVIPSSHIFYFSNYNKKRAMKS